MTQGPLSPSWSQASSLPDLSETESVPGAELEPTSPRTPASGVRFDEATRTWNHTDHDCGGQLLISSAQSQRPASIISISHMRSRGIVLFLVEDAEYIVDKVLFVNLHSDWTEAIHAASDGPIDLSNVTKSDFETLHGVLSTKSGIQFGDVNLESEECHAILRISSSWSLGSLYDAAVSRLDVLVAANHARRIEIGHMFQLKHWVDQGLGELCVRDDAPSLAEEPRLEKSDLRFLARVRSMAVTGTRDDAGFHRMFPDIPQWERLLNWYRCAYQGRILLQGFVYFTKRHLCFYSSVFGTTQISIPLIDITKAEKRYTAKIFPNAIAVEVTGETYLFSSLMTRDKTFRLLEELRSFA